MNATAPNGVASTVRDISSLPVCRSARLAKATGKVSGAEVQIRTKKAVSSEDPAGADENVHSAEDFWLGYCQAFGG